MNRVRWGLLSTARINDKLIPAIRSSSRGELKAVASRRKLKARRYARQKNIPVAFGSYEELLGSSEIDAVYISLPNHLHAEWAIKAMRAGKHVLCEKPLALTVEEVDEIIATSRETGMHAAEALMYRHHPQTMMIQQWIEEGRIGELQSVRGVFNFILDRASDFRFKPEMGGGVLWDIGIYPLSYSQFLMKSPPERVFGVQQLGESGIDLVFQGELMYPGNRMAQISCSFDSPAHTSVEIMGSKGRILLEKPYVNIGQGEKIKLYDRYSELSEYSAQGTSLYGYEVKNMHEVILEGAIPRVTLSESRNHIRTISCLLESAKENKVIGMDTVI